MTKADFYEQIRVNLVRWLEDHPGMRLEDVYYNPQIDPGFFRMTPDSSTNMSINGFAIRQRQPCES